MRRLDRFAPRGPGALWLLDNRDSFVFNLVHRLAEAGAEDLVVARSDEVKVDELVALRPRGLVLSPGPGRPEDAGICVEAVRRLSGVTPILGVCLGHQAITVAFGGRVDRSPPVHGRATAITHAGTGLFAGLPSPISVGRYHALAAEEPLPLTLTATARGGPLVMALRHRTHPTFGVQFHPESILTPDGPALLRRWLALR